jgi:hypothetical protein
MRHHLGYRRERGSVSQSPTPTDRALAGDNTNIRPVGSTVSPTTDSEGRKFSSVPTFLSAVRAIPRHSAEAVCDLGLEGIVSKRLTSVYRSGPSRTWIKVKNPKAPAATRAVDGTF